MQVKKRKQLFNKEHFISYDGSYTKNVKMVLKLEESLVYTKSM